MLLTGWMFLSCILFQYLGAFHIQFMTFGPSDATIFMGMPINTWGRWTFLAMFSFSNTAINVFLSNALGPWMQNTIQVSVSLFSRSSACQCWMASMHALFFQLTLLKKTQDHKCVTLPYKKQVCFFICQMECFYSHIMSIFGIFLFFSQLDFLLIRTAADLIVNGYSTVRFMKHKTVDPDMYLTSSRYANAAGMGECLHDEEVSRFASTCFLCARLLFFFIATKASMASYQPCSRRAGWHPDVQAGRREGGWAQGQPGEHQQQQRRQHGEIRGAEGREAVTVEV